MTLNKMLCLLGKHDYHYTGGMKLNGSKYRCCVCGKQMKRQY